MIAAMWARRLKPTILGTDFWFALPRPAKPAKLSADFEYAVADLRYDVPLPPLLMVYAQPLISDYTRRAQYESPNRAIRFV